MQKHAEMRVQDVKNLYESVGAIRESPLQKFGILSASIFPCNAKSTPSGVLF